MIKKYWIIASAITLISPAIFAQQNGKHPFVWEGANMYHIMTDRFVNGDKSNDVNYNRKSSNKEQSFQGGDLRGIINKIDEGYFKQLGVNVISLSPLMEQIHGSTSEGFAYHGTWTKDWTTLDKNFGTKAELQELIQKAHLSGIRVVMDVVLNHVGPSTKTDAQWPAEWVRSSPDCDNKSYKGNVSCTISKGLSDIKTESNDNVSVPEFLVSKWKAEGRYDAEMKSLDDFFARTGYPKAPKFYLIKWLSDYVYTFGFDGFRANNAINVEEDVWGQLKSQCNYALSQWKINNPKNAVGDDDFYLIGDLPNYDIAQGKSYIFPDKTINYFDYGFNSATNANFKTKARLQYQFGQYSDFLNNDLEYYTIVNSFRSTDVDNPYDAATILLLTPGISEITFGDEMGRKENPTTSVHWDALKSNEDIAKIHDHYKKLGQFRSNHPSIGAGIHKQIRQTPYIFSRGYDEDETIDRVIIALNVSKGFKDIPVASIFKTGTKLRDAYSGKVVEVRRDRVQFESDFTIVLLEQL